MYISIKDDNEFASCSDIEIKIFNIKKEENEFIIENKLFIENLIIQFGIGSNKHVVF